MDSFLNAFSSRAAALFETLREKDASPSFELRVATPAELDEQKTTLSEHEAPEPSPSPMTWNEVVEGSRNVQFEEGRICEPSIAARQAFEDEADYDEFDEVAMESIQSGYKKREKEQLNKEVVEADTDDSHPRQRKRGVPRYLRHPHNYICYTLDTPIYVGAEGKALGVVPDRKIETDIEMCEDPERKPETKIGTVFRRQEKRKEEDVQKTEDPTCSVATEALRSFCELDAEEGQANESLRPPQLNKRKTKRNYRSHQKDATQ